MPKAQLQFHAEAGELVSLASAWARDRGLHALAQWFHPDFEARPLDEEDWAGVRRICLGVEPFRLGATEPHTFLEHNPDTFVIDVGRRLDEGLRESSMSASTDDAAAMKVWRALIREAKSRMHHGADAVNPANGARGPWPRSHHTAGAHALAESGVPMLAVAGWIRYEFDDLAGPA